VYILDTNIMTYILKFPKQYPHLLDRIKRTPYEHIWISVITIEEAIKGAYKKMHQEHKPAACYQLLTWIITEYGKYQVLTYDEDDMRLFNKFSAAVRRAAQEPDRKIAATALRHRYTVITKNMGDFRVTGAQCEDWTII
jgi:toxin FitB